MFPWAYDQVQDALKAETIVYTIRSDKDANFTTAIAVNAKEDENLAGLASNKIRIKRVRAQADNNLNWEWYMWSTDGFEDADLDIDSFRGRYYHDSLNGVQIAAANQFYYDSGPTDITYEDLDGTFELHIALANRSGVAKTAGAAGEIIVDIDYEPMS